MAITDARIGEHCTGGCGFGCPAGRSRRRELRGERLLHGRVEGNTPRAGGNRLGPPGCSIANVDALPDVPVVVLLATALAAILVLVEAALPTFGVAGTAALGFATIAILSTGADDQSWWPLLFVVVAVLMWAVQLTVRRHHRVLEIAAAVAFAGGSIGYGIAASDVPAVVVAVLSSTALPLVFPRLANATRRILDQPPRAGMEALVGLSGEVVSSLAGPRPDDRVTVRVEGSLWNAHGTSTFPAGTCVVVTGFHGMTLDIAPRDTGDTGAPAAEPAR